MVTLEIHEHVYYAATNPCSVNNGGCSNDQICVLSSTVTMGRSCLSCKCAHSNKLNLIKIKIKIGNMLIHTFTC